ncbi:MAG: LD-carboxypeptidase [Myxococcota bacterium]|nr:LD-carboxypeptidase [Myxococcota bacterium]
MDELRKPRALHPGDTLGVAAPGGPVDPERTKEGIALLEKAGFRVWHRDDLFARRGYLAGDDARRLGELMELVEDSRIAGIVCARGGYGCDRILADLDPEPFARAAKPLVGYSDITALLLWQARHAGLAGLHGPMLERGDELDRRALDDLVAWLTGARQPPVPLVGEPLAPGEAQGHLVGGSLTLVAASLGTSWEIDTRGGILLVEDVGESPYRIDRMLQQLRGAGKLESLAGLGFGDFASCLDPRYGTHVDDVLAELAGSLGVPCVRALPFGHVDANATWPFGGRATIDGDRGEIRILEPAVEVPQ